MNHATASLTTGLVKYGSQNVRSCLARSLFTLSYKNFFQHQNHPRQKDCRSTAWMLSSLKRNGLQSKFIHSTNALNMFIQVEDTPNPNSLKFYPGEPVLESGTADFQDKRQAAMKSPLAKALFKIDGVKSVFFAQDFIVVTKTDDDMTEWNVLKPQIFSAIMIFYTMKQPILYVPIDGDSTRINENDSEIVKQIKELIDEKIRPTVQEDGGDLEFVSYEDNIVKLKLQGACTSCPSSMVTLKSGVKNMLCYHIPDVIDVIQVTDDD